MDHLSHLSAQFITVWYTRVSRHMWGCICVHAFGGPEIKAEWFSLLFSDLFSEIAFLPEPGPLEFMCCLHWRTKEPQEAYCYHLTNTGAKGICWHTWLFTCAADTSLVTDPSANLYLIHLYWITDILNNVTCNFRSQIFCSPQAYDSCCCCLFSHVSDLLDLN